MKWWNSADAATQKDIVTQFETLAKANPKDDLLLHVGLRMARHFADSDEISNAMHDIVEQDGREKSC